MSEENDKDLQRTEELYAFLQGEVPKGYTLEASSVPRLTPEQAWTVIWYLGGLYWQVTDHVEKCDICGAPFNGWESGECMDFGKAPYHFCDECSEGDEARLKRRIGRRLERSRLRSRKQKGASR